MLGDKNMPADLVPYWDYDAPNIPNEPRDVSTAAIIASAFYEMYTYTGTGCISRRPTGSSSRSRRRPTALRWAATAGSC